MGNDKASMRSNKGKTGAYSKGGGGKGKSAGGGGGNITPLESIQQPELTGSEKQKEWAVQIRRGILSDYKLNDAEARFKDMMKRKDLSKENIQFERDLLSLRRQVENLVRTETSKIKSAKDFIEGRNTSLRYEIIRKNIGKFKDNPIIKKSFPKPSDFLRWV